MEALFGRLSFTDCIGSGASTCCHDQRQWDVYAIVAANNDTTASDSCVKSTGADIIRLPANPPQTLTTDNNTNYDANELLTIGSTITIHRQRHHHLRASTVLTFRIFQLDNLRNLQ
jgi:hypothetical protein